MKTTLLFVILIFFKILITISMIWAAVSFLLYLVKDIPFDWNSIYSIVFLLGLSVFTYFGILFFSFKKVVEKEEERVNPKLSKFQQRIKEMQLKQNR